MKMGWIHTIYKDLYKEPSALKTVKEIDTHLYAVHDVY